MATILTKKKDTTGAPATGDLTNSSGGAELAVNTADKRLYTKDSGGNVVEVGTNPGTAVTFTAGTNSAPAITTTGDTNTGIFFPAADQVAIATNGVERVNLGNSVTVFNDGGANVDFRVEGDTEPNLLFVDASTDKVGIGTNGPSGTLSVASATTGTLTDSAQVLGTGNVENVRLMGYGYGGNQSGLALFAGSTGSAAVGLFGLKTGTNQAALAIRMDTGTGTSAERMRIDSSGNAGIGTSTPSGRLHISNGASTSLLYVTGQSRNALIGQNANGMVVYQEANADMLFGTNNTERMRIDSSGNLLVGTTTNSSGALIATTSSVPFTALTPVILARSATSSASLVSISNSTATRTHCVFETSTATVGSITTASSSTAYNTSSDYRLKDNVAPMTGALAKVLELNPVTYTWKVDGSAGEGFIAHELQAVCPEAVTGEKDATQIRQVEISPAVYEDVVIPAVLDEDDNEVEPERTEKRLVSEAVMEDREFPVYQGVDTSFLVATLTAAIQELSAKNDALEARLAVLEAK
jgi:hypothetical protein